MRWYLLAWVLFAACTHRVEVQVPATPSVQLEGTAVRVVAAERGCQSVANAVTDVLRRRSNLTVDPRASLRVDVFGCGESWQLDLQAQVSEDGVRRRMALSGRAYAAAVVSRDGVLEGRLIGSSRSDAADPWLATPQSFRGLRRRARVGLPDRVAVDLVAQLDPLPRPATRRVFAHARAGTRRELHNLAVAAERYGDLETALFLAAAVHDERPTPRSASYLYELARRRLLLADRPDGPPSP